MSEGREIAPGIWSTPDVVGGDPCIRHTRIPVSGLEEYRHLGMSDADLLENYPSLTAYDLDNAWAYVKAHPDEIDRLIEEDETA